MGVLFVLVLGLVTSAFAQASSLVGVDLRDVVKYSNTHSFGQADLGLIYEALIKDAKQVFPEGVRYSREGATYPWDTQQNLVYSIGLSGYPAPEIANPSYALVAFFHSTETGYVFRKFIASIDRATGQTTFENKNDVPLSQTQFGVRVSLIDRKAIVEDPINGLVTVYPLDVGAFDEGVETLGKVTLETPLFRNPSLRKDQLVLSRVSPEYFRGRPFIRVASRNAWTSVGFHIYQGSGVYRMFASHGCIRLREGDLYELATILYQGPHESITLQLKLDLPADSIDHPMAPHNSGYMRVKNFGTPEAPLSQRGEDGLLILEYVQGMPPVDKLTPTELLFTYQTLGDLRVAQTLH